MVVPGYGLAAAQAQNAVYSLMEALQSEGKEVKFGIHPVAGRMPGHMNVLLTEADIPYKQLYDMEDINPEFEDTDAVIIVGANDVVNPVARNKDRQTAITGMPILDVGRGQKSHLRQTIPKPRLRRCGQRALLRPGKDHDALRRRQRRPSERRRSRKERLTAQSSKVWLWPPVSS